MRSFVVPSDITVTLPAGMAVAPAVLALLATPFSFARVAADCWLNDQRAGDTFVKLTRWSKVITAVTAAKAGETFKLDDEDWGTLKTIIETPAMGYPPVIAVRLLPFMNAVLEAKQS